MLVVDAVFILFKFLDVFLPWFFWTLLGPQYRAAARNKRIEKFPILYFCRLFRVFSLVCCCVGTTRVDVYFVFIGDSTPCCTNK